MLLLWRMMPTWLQGDFVADWIARDTRYRPAQNSRSPDCSIGRTSLYGDTDRRWTSVRVSGSATIRSSAVGQGHRTSDNNTRGPAPSTTKGPIAGREGVRMQAIVLRELGGPEQLRLETV